MNKISNGHKVVKFLAAYSRIKFESGAAFDEDVAALDAALKVFAKKDCDFKSTDSDLRELAECTITELHIKYGRRNAALMNVIGAIGRVMGHETVTAKFLRDQSLRVAEVDKILGERKPTKRAPLRH